MALKRVALLMIILFCAVGSYQAFQWGMANLYFLKAESYLKRWYSEENSIDDSQWQDALEAIELSITKHPENSQYLNAKAKILMFGAQHQYEDPKSLYRVALETLQTSLSFRPTWGETWIDAAMINWHLGEIDDVFWQQVANADRFGPYIPEVNLGIATVYLAFWQQLEPAKRVVGVEHMKRVIMVRNNGDFRFNFQQELFNRMEQYNKQGVICMLIKLDKTVAQRVGSNKIKKYCAPPN